MTTMMTTTTETDDGPTLTRAVGQRVLLTGGRFHDAARIVRVNPVNIVVQPENSDRQVNAHPSYLSDLPEGAPVPPTSLAPLRAERFCAGELVRMTGGAGRKFGDGVHVVLVDRTDKVNVARLGGDNGRYVRVPPAMLERVAVPDSLN